MVVGLNAAVLLGLMGLAGVAMVAVALWGIVVETVLDLFYDLTDPLDPVGVGDSSEFREILRKWEVFVLERRGTIREVKRFANRARFVVLDAPKGWDESLVGFVALEDYYEELNVAREDFDFETWLARCREDKTLPKDWLGMVEKKQWTYYRDTAIDRSHGMG